jgi:hypothetical protein
LKQAISEVEKTRNMDQAPEQNSFRAIRQLELLLDSVMGDRALLAEMLGACVTVVTAHQMPPMVKSIGRA